MKKAFTLVEVLVLSALIGVAATAYHAVKAGWFSGETKRVEQSVKTTNDLNQATTQRDAKAASVFSAIGTTNAEAPESPQKRVINRFVPIGLGLTGTPDSDFLQQLNKLKQAEMQGKIDQANTMNASLLGQVSDINRKYTQAVAAKTRSDNALVEADAERRAAEAQRDLMAAVAGLCVILFLWVKSTHFSPGQIANYVSDLRNPVQADAVTMLDVHASPLQQKVVAGITSVKNLLAKLRS